MAAISVIICCHNSGQRIRETLECLQAMQLPEHPWEVLIINNNCTDETVPTAQKAWAKNPVTSLKIIKEPLAGLSNARIRGIKESSFPIIAFVDDDNHLPPTWVNEAQAFMDKHPDCSACGGPITPKCESPPPPWFQRFKGNYSTYDYYTEDKSIAHALAGAGLVVRKKHLEFLYKNGFSSILSDRKGLQLNSGGDYELCYALLLAGGTIWFNPNLKIEHFIPTSRLQWKYLKRLNQGFGEQAPILEMYEQLVRENLTPFSWKREAYCSIPSILALALKTLKDCVAGKLEGSHNQLLLINQSFRLISLLRQRSEYDRHFIALEGAPWNKLNPHQSNASS